MSDTNEGVYGSAPDGQTGQTGAVDTAKAEAGEVKDTAVGAAKDVTDTAKDEAGAVLDETRSSAIDLYHQTRDELSDQAAKQQERLSSGLRTVADDFGQMARSADNSGMASDIVERMSRRLGHASTWLSQRDPAGVLAEVKSFARRRPGTFILGAVAAGVVVGRLTRALATNAADDRNSSPSRSLPAGHGTAASGRGQRPTTGSVGESDLGASSADAPLYAETATRWSGQRDGSGDERPDSL